MRDRLPHLVAIAVLTGFLLTLAAPAPAHAHPEYLRSNPAANAVLENAPPVLTLSFTEPIEERFLDLAVFAEAGERVDRGDAMRLANGRDVQVGLGVLGAGGYLVRWRAMGYDGHLVAGSFAFGIGQAASAPLAPAASSNVPSETLVRWGALIALGGMSGGVLIALLLRGLGTAEARRWLESQVLGTCWAAFAVFLGAAVLELGAKALAAGAGGLDFSRLGDVLLGSRYGQLWMARMILLSALGAVLAQVETLLVSPDAATTVDAAPEIDRRGRWWVAAGGLNGLLALTLTVAGHSIVTDPVVVSVAVDWLHLAAGVLWIGGLLHLVALRIAARGGEPLQRELLTCVIPRFGVVAALLVGLLVPSGLYNAWVQASPPAELAQTAYGATLLGKIAVVALLLVVAGWHVVPRFATAGQGRFAGSPGSRLLAVELAMGLTVIGAASLLAALPPARGTLLARTADVSIPAAPTDADRLTLANHAGEYLLTVTFQPAHPGANAATIEVTDGNGRPVDDARIRVDSSASSSPPVDAQRVGPGRFAAPAALAPTTTTVRVAVQRGTEPERVASFGFAPPLGSGAEVLRRADAAMNDLVSLTERQTIETGTGEPLIATYEYGAPDRLRAIDSSGGVMVAAVGQRFELQDGTWRAEPWPAPAGFRWPTYAFAPSAIEQRLLGIELVDGRAQLLVSFADRQGARYLLWIDSETFRIRREQMMAPGHYMLADFSAFDATEDVTVPVAGSTATDSGRQ